MAGAWAHLALMPMIQDREGKDSTGERGREWQERSQGREAGARVEGRAAERGRHSPLEREAQQTGWRQGPARRWCWEGGWFSPGGFHFLNEIRSKIISQE